MQIYNAYRVKHGLPFPDELTSLRQMLNLSAAKMSAILGLGTNQYRLYEKGDMPVDAVGRYIKMLIDNKSALKDCIEKNKAFLTENEYNFALSAIEDKTEDVNMNKLLMLRNKDNGYAPLAPNRTQNLILYLLNRLGPVSPTFLNKILFYADFMAYHKQGMAISGFSYRALPYGPVPNNWKYIPLIEGIDQQENDMGTLLVTNVKTDTSGFSEKEINIIDAVITRFNGMTASRLSTLSLQEDAWTPSCNDVKKTISFDHAFSLKAI